MKQDGDTGTQAYLCAASYMPRDKFTRREGWATTLHSRTICFFRIFEIAIPYTIEAKRELKCKDSTETKQAQGRFFAIRNHFTTS